MKNRNFIYSLEKGLSIIGMFSSESSRSLSEIAHQRQMSIGSAHRYLNTLNLLGYIKQNPETKRYALTPKVLDLGFSALRGMSLRKRILPYLLQISREYSITTACSILDGTDILYIERIRGAGLVNLDLSAGSRLPLYCTSMGKVLLAFLPEKEREAIIKKLELRPLTPHTITHKPALRRELEIIRKRGYATCRQELNLGLESIAGPVFHNHQVEAAISFNLPNATHKDGNKDKNDGERILIDRLLQLSKDISI